MGTAMKTSSTSDPVEATIGGADVSSSRKDEAAYDLGESWTPNPMHTPILRQLYWCVRKNFLVIIRRPIMLFFMLCSSVFSVLIAWPTGRDADPAKFPDLDLFDQCGVVPEYRWQEKFKDEDIWDYDEAVIVNLNHSWNSGLQVSMLSLGPYVHAVCVFILIHFEIEKKLVGVIRGLGVRDVVYWMSWYIPFIFTSLLNALFGAITAQFLPVHVFQNVYFGGIFGSLFFLHLAMTSASFFLASVSGSNGKLMVFLILVMTVSVFVPPIVINSVTYGESMFRTVSTQWNPYPYYPFSGLSWKNMNTNKTHYANYGDNSTYVWNDSSGTWEYIEGVKIMDNLQSCNSPIMNEEEGTRYKTEEESMDEVTPDEFFIGCYVQPGFTSAVWNPESTIGFVVLYLFPYFHFTSIYSNFIGYTGHPGKTFTPIQANLSPEELAVALLPALDESLSLGTTLFPQGSTLRSERYDDWEAEREFQDLHGVESTNDDPFYYPSWVTAYTCPVENVTTEYDLCDESVCNYVKNSTPLIGSPSVHDLFGHLVLLSIVYFIMALLWLQILPVGNGKRKNIFSCCKSKGDYAHENVFSSVLIRNVSKNFGACKAVNGVTLELKKGQITALLGHNGAGKSTLSNILSCETDPSSGEIFMFGRSVVRDAFNIRRLMGICKQDDFLWPDLTAKEHLDIFAGLRGVDPSTHNETVQKWLESVDLSDVQHTTSSTFSGGMKRRLSVALSTIGNRPFLIFDEPTTGMDPVSRRFVWKHLDEIKDDKVILLTTHAMEEADLLADEVAIMKDGKLAALGSPLELKSNHGSVIQFNVLVDKDEVDETQRMINRIFSEHLDVIEVGNGDAGNITVRVENIKTQLTEASNNGKEKGVDVKVLTRFVEWLESENNSVREYGFSNSSLEEVFINITQDGNQVGLEEVQQNNSTAYAEEINQEEHIDIEDDGDHLTRMQPKMTLIAQVKSLVRMSFIRKWTGIRRSMFEYIFFGLFLIGTIIEGLGVANLREESWYSSLIISLQVIPIGGLSLLLVSTVFPLYQDRALGLFHLMRTQGLFHSSYVIGNAMYSFLIQSLYGVILITFLFATPLFRETKLCDHLRSRWSDDYDAFLERFDEDRQPFICDAFGPSNNAFGQRYQSLGANYYFSDPADVDNKQVLRIVDTPGSYWQIIAAPLIFALSTPGSAFFSSIIPGNYKFCMVVVGFFTVVAFLFPIVYYNYMTFKVQFNYSGGYYWYDDDYYENPLQDRMLQSCIESIDPDNLCPDLHSSLERNITQEYFLNCIGFDLIQNAVIGSYCTPSYVSLLPQYGILQLFVLTYYSKIKFWPESMETYRNMFPDDDGFCKGDTCKIPLIEKAYRRNLLFFFVGALVLNVIGFGVFMFRFFSPTFLLKFKQFLCKISCSKMTQQEKETNEDDIKNEEVIIEENKIDEILGKEISSKDDLPPILMHHLRKVYPSSGRSPQKVALKSLSLQVPKGEVCGLLGKNGSGKTTALKILSCAHESTSGTALVAGHDTSCEKIQVFESLGNCPQFDVVWPSLSVGEHLEFFARLKGFTPKEALSASQSMAKAVGLGSTEVYNRRASDLSGGMRRRLSIAIALLGAPGVFLLDEPTTGLDPHTRNNLWNLITSFATKDRAIIITTHMMIEADTLCNRIAIIGKGRLKVVATQQYLKDTYGSGYILQLNLINSSQEHQNKAMAFVKTNLHPEASLDHKQAKTLHVHLPKDINLTKVFKNLYSTERISEGCINQFLLSQSSLEDVFLALGD